MSTRPGYGPNYPTAQAEAKAMRKQHATSWFDAWAFALLLLCVLTPVFYLVGHADTHNTCRTTQTLCSTGVQS